MIWRRPFHVRALRRQRDDAPPVPEDFCLGGHHRLAAPAFSRAAERPVITHGVQSGRRVVDSDGVARTDRPARMLIEVSTTDSFKDIRHTAFVDALPESDFTAKARSGRRRARHLLPLALQDLSSPKITWRADGRRFRTAPSERRSVSFVVGRHRRPGWGIDASRGGMRTYATMLRNRPGLLCPLRRQHLCRLRDFRPAKAAEGRNRRNIVTEEKSKIAETLAEYRGNYKYNLSTKPARFQCRGSTFAQWTIHEVMEDWWPGETLNRRDYAEKNTMLLAARGCRAFHEFMPLRYTPAEPGRIYRKISYGPLLDVFMLDMRSYRGPNNARPDADSHILGAAQLAWLKRELARSEATWKVIATDTPLGVIAPDAPGARTPLGWCVEVADLLSFMKRAGIRNTLWITADLH